MQSKEELINKVLETLDKKNITLYRLMVDTGLSKKTVYALKNSNPTMQTLLTICNYLGLEVRLDSKE